MDKKKIYRILVVILAVISIILVVALLLLGKRELLFIPILPVTIAAILDKQAKKHDKSDKF